MTAVCLLSAKMRAAECPTSSAGGASLGRGAPTPGGGTLIYEEATKRPPSTANCLLCAHALNRTSSRGTARVLDQGACN